MEISNDVKSQKKIAAGAKTCLEALAAVELMETERGSRRIPQRPFPTDHRRATSVYRSLEPVYTFRPQPGARYPSIPNIHL